MPDARAWSQRRRGMTTVTSNGESIIMATLRFRSIPIQGKSTAQIFSVSFSLDRVSPSIPTRVSVYLSVTNPSGARR